MIKKSNLLVVYYLSFLSWWFALALTGSTSGLGNSYFNLAMGLYAALISLSIISRAVGTDSVYQRAILFSMAGTMFFGLGTIMWFYYDVFLKTEIPFPSLSDIFYVLEFPLTAFGLLVLLGAKQKILPLVGFLYSVVLVLSFMIKVHDNFVENLLLVYFPIESFSITMLALLTYIKGRFKLSKQLTFIVFGHLIWFLADGLFISEILSLKYFNAGLPDILYLTGLFLIFTGFESILDSHINLGFGSTYNFIYKTYSSISLNLKILDSNRLKGKMNHEGGDLLNE